VLADLVLVLHAAYVSFVVGGLGLIWIGVRRQWRWTRNLWLRSLHLAAIGLVALEAILGWSCPLTVLEDHLRSSAGEPEFVARWLRRLLFWDFPAWVFTAGYIAFTALVVATWIGWPPRLDHSDRRTNEDGQA